MIGQVRTTENVVIFVGNAFMRSASFQIQTGWLNGKTPQNAYEIPFNKPCWSLEAAERINPLPTNVYLDKASFRWWKTDKRMGRQLRYREQANPRFLGMWKSTKKYSWICKKCLTNGVGRGNICKLSDERPLRGAGGSWGGRKSRKRVKKLLTKWSCCDRINEFQPKGMNEPVPCKLNNEKTN